MTTKKERIFYITLGILVILTLVFGALYEEGAIFPKKTEETVQVTKQTTVQTAEQVKTLSYQGQDGKTALELLESAATIEKSGEGENAYITSINGVAADSTKEYWAFSINGEASMVGAGSYVTKSSDVIKWDLTTF